MSGVSRTALPVDDFIEPIRDALRSSRAVIITAAPGAGKTTRVPPALVPDGRVMLLQPRRVAARAIARRVAEERGWTLGREVGWQIRQDRNFTRDTQLLVVTEGILTARLQSDPLLSDFSTVVIDEFHERSVHADVAIALAKQAWIARSDLRIVVISATLDTAAVSSFLHDCPVIEVPGRLYPLDITYAPRQSVADAALELLDRTSGNILCFLPGAAEIARVVGSLTRGVDVVPLHGSLESSDQDRAIRPSAERRIIVSTNIAETSLTVPGVTAVVDSGLHKVARYDADRGIDSLETERITMDAADQRAGRAGRLAPGVVRRLWDARDRLRPHREPEIHRIDLSSAVLDVIAWGGDPRTFDWFERPREDALDAAINLLRRLDVIAADPKNLTFHLTAIGEQSRRIPMHPRLARIVVAADGARAVMRACEFLTDGHRLPPRTASTASDLLSIVDDRQVDERAFCRAIFAGYPDRIAKRREPRSQAVLLSTGAGATMGRESGVQAEFMVAVDVTNDLIRIASAIERDWLEPTSAETVHRFDTASQSVKAVVVKKYDAIVLSEHPTTPDAETAARLLSEAWAPSQEDQQLIRRATFAGRPFDLDALVRTAAYGVRTLAEVDLTRALDPARLRDLDRDAPVSIPLPSGRTARLDYQDDGSVTASVKLQELFGLADTPRIGPRREPVLLALLAPNGRPVQLTRDLRSFWDRTYPEVRKELRGRYPKHPWPDDPWNATPTHRTTRR
ncbi:MAG TPA: ATP-dependent helicase C-terminal domain-containing protein [Vicinamibacterales bacterium]|nr:ATP-dependent helicase C-terminal domain-containing protein [Vicinamibacterales bacterium]